MSTDDITQQPLVPDTRPMLERILSGVQDIQAQLLVINNRLDAIESRLDSIESRLDGIDKELSRQDAKIDLFIEDVIEMRRKLRTA
jgi:peptidoglycan hydrolase CwlO-like protein